MWAPGPVWHPWPPTTGLWLPPSSPAAPGGDAVRGDVSGEAEHRSTQWLELLERS